MNPVTLPRAIAMCLALVVLQGCGNVVGSAGNSFQGAYEESFEANFKVTFTRSCRDNGVAQGVPAAEMERVCPCAADDLVKQYAPKQLTALSSQQGMKAMTTCAKKLGYIQ